MNNFLGHQITTVGGAYIKWKCGKAKKNIWTHEINFLLMMSFAIYPRKLKRHCSMIWKAKICWHKKQKMFQLEWILVKCTFAPLIWNRGNSAGKKSRNVFMMLIKSNDQLCGKVYKLRRAIYSICGWCEFAFNLVCVEPYWSLFMKVVPNWK